MKTMLSKVERKKLAEQRCSQSLAWRTVHALGSLDLAILLLLSLAGVSAVATFLESGFSARVARAYVYNAPWFNVWLLLLALNLTCSAATRWPWERKHAGFVITHVGILVLLAGALLGRAKGFEGSVDLLKGAPPSREILLDRPRLTVESPATGQLFSTPFDPEVRPPRPVPRKGRAHPRSRRRPTGPDLGADRPFWARPHLCIAHPQEFSSARSWQFGGFGIP
jgi:hypothetical protein